MIFLFLRSCSCIVFAVFSLQFNTTVIDVCVILLNIPEWRLSENILRFTRRQKVKALKKQIHLHIKIYLLPWYLFTHLAYISPRVNHSHPWLLEIFSSSWFCFKILSSSQFFWQVCKPFDKPIAKVCIMKPGALCIALILQQEWHIAVILLKSPALFCLNCSAFVY